MDLDGIREVTFGDLIFVCVSVTKVRGNILSSAVH